MDANLDKVALDLYGKIQNRFPDIKIGDETGDVLSKKEDIPRARFFEFEYEEGGEPLGSIAITLDPKDGVVMQISGDLVDDDNPTKHSAFQFIRSFRKFAKSRILKFKVENMGKSELDKRDYEFKSKRKEEPMTQMPVMESKFYGTNKISYQDLGEARLVIKHNQAIDPELPTGRTMHIESIYIENAVGERFRYPAKHINGARALAEHIKAGGTPYDGIGKHIIGLSEELAQLRKFKNYVGRQEQLSEAMGDITSKVMERIEEVKKEIHYLQRPAYYQQFAESFAEQESKSIPETVMNDWIDRLTIRTFNEELKSVFPYIYKLVDESELPILEIDAEDILDSNFNDLAERANPRWAELNVKALAMLEKGMTVDQVGKALGVQGPNHGTPGSMGGDWGAINSAARELEERKQQPQLYPRSPRYESLEDQFENFIEELVNEDKDEIFSPNKDAQRVAIDKLNKILGSELRAGPDAVNAVGSLKGLIDDPEFLLGLKDIDGDLDVRPLIQQYILQRDPEVAAQLEIGEPGEQEAPPPAPVEPPAAPAQPAAAAPAAPTEPPAAPAQQAPVAEDEDPPFEPDKPKKNPSAIAGKHGQGHSTARHLARHGLMKAIQKAKAAGADLNTKLDFGHREMTLHDAIKECGMTAMECGFEEKETGIPAMLRYISGFYNANANESVVNEGNFTIGATRMKIKLKKAAENGEFGDVSPQEVAQVMKFIDTKDQSGHEQSSILKLAGINRPEMAVGETGEMPDFGSMMSQMQKMMGNIQQSPTSQVSQSNTSSGMINGKPASYDDAIAQANNMKFKLPKFGDDDTDDDVLDFSKPDQIGQTLQKKIGGALNKVQGQLPNQNMQFPGGQINPADFMKHLLQQMNTGK